LGINYGANLRRCRGAMQKIYLLGENIWITKVRILPYNSSAAKNINLFFAAFFIWARENVVKNTDKKKTLLKVKMAINYCN